ncbi:MAG: hypothetical protein QXZ41_02030 [Ignisphaera sp.]
MPRKSQYSQSKSKRFQQSESTKQSPLPTPHQSSTELQKLPTSVEQPASSTTVASTSPSKSATHKKKYIDTESWVDRNLDELIDAFNLGILDLTKDEAKIIITKLIDILRGEAATIDKDTIRRRFTRNVQQMNQVIAHAILELREELTLNQLEFVVNNVGEAVLGYAPRLYNEIAKHCRHDLLEILRTTWRTYWIQRKHQLLPVVCPRCGFNSLMPDLTCIVCGASVDEGELKKYTEFEKLLQDFVAHYSEDDVRKTITYGYVYLNNLGLKPPTHERDKLDIEILLSIKEKDFLKSLLSNKGG